MKLRLLYMLAFAALLSFSACKDDDEPTVREQLIGSWQLTKIVETDAGVTVTIEGQGLGEACDRDDLYTFKANNTLELSEGPTKCDPSDPQVYDSGTYSLLNDDTQLQLSFDGDVEVWTITTLNGSTLEITYSETYSEGGEVVEYTESFIFEKQ